MITDHGSEFVNPRQDERPDPDHAFEGYLHDNDIMHTLGKVGRPQSNGKIERFYQTYDKHRWRLGSLERFLTFYNEERPHMSLDWDNRRRPMELLTDYLHLQRTVVSAKDFVGVITPIRERIK